MGLYYTDSRRKSYDVQTDRWGLSMRVGRASLVLIFLAVLPVVPTQAQGVGGRWGNLYETTVINDPGCPVQLDQHTRARRPDLETGARFAEPGNIKGHPRPDQIGAELRVIVTNFGPAKVTEVDVQWRAYNEQNEQVWAYGQVVSLGSHPLGLHDYFPGALFVPAPPKEAAKVTVIIVRVVGENGEICPNEKQTVETQRVGTQAAGTPTAETVKEVSSSPESKTASVVVPLSTSTEPVAALEEPSGTACICRLTTSEQAFAIRAAAAKGDSEALLAVGTMYLSGRFEIQNYVLAHAWFNVASAHGQPMGERCRSLVETKMDEREIARAQDEALKIQKQLSKSPE